MRIMIRPRRFGIRLTVLACVASLVACGNPLQREAPLQTNLSPTRTPAPEPEVTTPPPPPQATTTTTSGEQAQPAAESTEALTASVTSATVTSAPTTATSIKTRFDLCGAVKPGLQAITSQPSQATGQIVYLTTDSNIVLTDDAGRARVNITSDAYVTPDGSAGRIYMFPTFSRDGKSIAFVSLSTTADFNGITQTVHVAPAVDGATLTDLFATSEWNIPYLDFSPDSKQVAFLTIGGQAGAIRVVSTGGGDVSVFDTGSPTYWHWREDSAAMVAHLGGRATEKGTATISRIEANGAVKGQQMVFDALPGKFQSPHYSPDGKHMLYVANTGGNGNGNSGAEQDELILADANGTPVCTLTPIADNAFFAWSADGVHVAVMDTLAPVNQPAAVRVFDLATGNDKVVKEDATAFFWSPDGGKLAVYSVVTNAQLDRLGAQTGSNKLSAPVMLFNPPVAYAQGNSLGLRIEVIDVASGSTTKVADTYPSRQLQQYFQFFDQYSRSLSPWSPSGKQLVFTSVSPSTENADVAVATLKVEGATTKVDLKRVAAGTIAFWSSR